MSHTDRKRRIAETPAVAGSDLPAPTAERSAPVIAGSAPGEDAEARLRALDRRVAVLENGRRPTVAPSLGGAGAERAERLLAVMQESLRDLADDVRDLHEQLAVLVSAPAGSSAEGGSRPDEAQLPAHVAAVLVRRLAAAEARIRRLEPRRRLSLRSAAVWLARLPWRVIRRAAREAVRPVRALRAAARPEPPPADLAAPAAAVRHVLASRPPLSAPLLTVVLAHHGEEDRRRQRAALDRQSVTGHDVVEWDVQSGAFSLRAGDGSSRVSGSAADARELRTHLRSEYVCALRGASGLLPATWLEVGSRVASGEGLLFVELECRHPQGWQMYHPDAGVLPDRRPASDLMIVRRDIWDLDGGIGMPELGEIARGGPIVIGKRLPWTCDPPCRAAALAQPAEPLWTPDVRWLGAYLFSSPPRSPEVTHAVFEVAEPGRAAAAPAGESVVIVLDRLPAGSEWWQAPAFRVLAARGCTPVLVELDHPAGATGALPGPWARLSPLRYDLAAHVAPPLRPSELARIVARHGARAVVFVGRAEIEGEAVRRLRERHPEVRLALWSDSPPATPTAGAAGIPVLTFGRAGAVLPAGVAPRLQLPAIDGEMVARLSASDHVAGVREGLGVGASAVLVAAVAGGRPEERVEDVVALASRLRDDPALALVAVGYGSGGPEWPATVRAASPGAASREASGETFPSLLAAADAVCLPAECDLSWVAALALALGKPVVATREAAGALPEIGAGGLRVAGRAGDLAALASALRDLLDPSQRAALAAAAHASAPLFAPAGAADALASVLHLGR